MDEIPPVVWIAGGVSVIVIVVIYVIFVLQRRNIDLTHSKSPDQKPVWMETTPPPETIAATQADGEGVGLYGRDSGEGLAPAFVEQVEDIVRARLREDPSLAGTSVDFGTASGGGLEIVVNGERYADVDAIPDGRLQEIIHQAIASWEQER